MKMYPDQDTFRFMQGHVIMNQPMRIIFRARETADVSQEVLMHLQCWTAPLGNAVLQLLA